MSTIDHAARTAGLRRIRRRRRSVLIGWGIVILAVAIHIGTAAPRRTRDVVLLMAVAVYGVTTLTAAFARCPGCGHLFHNVYSWRLPVPASCQGCGLGLDGTPGIGGSDLS